MKHLIKGVDFLTTKARKGAYDIQILNPPFSGKKEGSGGGRGLWKRFLDKALENATKDTITICFVPRTTTDIRYEHEVLIDTATFDNAATSAKVILIRGEGTTMKRKKLSCAFDIKTKQLLPSQMAKKGLVFNEECVAFPLNGTFKSNSELKVKQYSALDRGASMAVFGNDVHKFSKFIRDNSTFEDWNTYFAEVRRSKNGMLNLSHNDIMTFVNKLGA